MVVGYVEFAGGANSELEPREWCWIATEDTPEDRSGVPNMILGGAQQIAMDRYILRRSHDPNICITNTLGGRLENSLVSIHAGVSFLARKKLPAGPSG
jgi:hypothetical protein